MTADERDLLAPGPLVDCRPWVRSVSLYVRRETNEMGGVRFG
jgi:hypothetical protein